MLNRKRPTHIEVWTVGLKQINFNYSLGMKFAILNYTLDMKFHQGIKFINFKMRISLCETNSSIVCLLEIEYIFLKSCKLKFILLRTQVKLLVFV